MTTNSSPRRYVTVLATVEVPDDDVWDQIIADRVSSMIHGMTEEFGLTLAPCDFTIDVDTLTDGLGAEYGTVTLLDLNPPRIRPVEWPDEIPPGAVCIEATCEDCGQVYNPEFPDDEHIEREDGTPCGGLPTNVGWWS